MSAQLDYWQAVWKKFYRRRLGRFALFVVILFCLVGIYAPFLASSKPLFLIYHGEPYFPLFRYLLYQGFFTKRLDLFFNLLIFSFPLFLIGVFLKRKIWLLMLLIGQIIAFLLLINFPLKDPAASPALTEKRLNALKQGAHPTWDWTLAYMTPYAQLNLLIQNRNLKEQNHRLEKYSAEYEKAYHSTIPTLWQVREDNYQAEIKRLQGSQKAFIEERHHWIESQTEQLRFVMMPLLSHFHWEEDAGGQQALNQYLHWWEMTRINRKDLLAALIFGVRISLVVGIISVGIALFIGVPIGALAGYYGGYLDIIVSRLLEIWEAMPVFFMLLMVVAIMQSKSVFLVIAIIGLFSWTSFSRYIRGEFFKQRNLPYVEACHSLGFKDSYIIFRHILPNALPPILTLLPFAIMAAISSEAGLSFLGLGEENSCSWGVLMDEGRTAFPAESYLLWPPATLLTILLIAIAIVGDNLRDTLDPKLSN